MWIAAEHHHEHNYLNIEYRIMATPELTWTKKGSRQMELRMPQLEQIEAIEKRLWKAADTLRANSNYASNEYFLPVMGLVFLRHAYSRFLAVRESIQASLPKRCGKTRPPAKEDFSQKGAIFLRPCAQFDHLLSLPDSEDRARDIMGLGVIIAFKPKS